jgi:threonine/homoserine/homoserine lactone efflux protein
MEPLVGDLLPLAVVVAISPVPIVAVILMLLAPEARGTSMGFLTGWLVGIAGITTVVLLVAGDTDRAGSRSSTAASWVELVLGVLLLPLAVQQWRSRPRPGEKPAAPRWIAATDRFTAPRAGGLGLVLSVANPKALLVCVAAGATIAASNVDGVQATWSVVGFTVIAASSVAVPVLAYAVAGTRMTPALESLRSWLTVRGAAVTAVLLLAIGLVLIGQGLGGLV